MRFGCPSSSLQLVFWRPENTRRTKWFSALILIKLNLGEVVWGSPRPKTWKIIRKLSLNSGNVSVRALAVLSIGWWGGVSRSLYLALTPSGPCRSMPGPGTKKGPSGPFGTRDWDSFKAQARRAPSGPGSRRSNTCHARYWTPLFTPDSMSEICVCVCVCACVCVCVCVWLGGFIFLLVT